MTPEFQPRIKGQERAPEKTSEAPSFELPPLFHEVPPLTRSMMEHARQESPQGRIVDILKGTIR